MTDKVGFKIELNAMVASVRLAQPHEAMMANGKLLSDVVLIRNNFVVGSFVVSAVKPLKIGKKFEAVICFKEMSEEEYKAKVTEGLIEVGDKNKDVGII